MENILLPKIEFKTGDKPNTGILIIEPLFPGYGTTIGNTLRRVLLSSLPGAAVTAVKINGITHEFTTIPKVKEDVLNLILNIKQLRLISHNDEPVTLKLKAKGEMEVTAKQIEKNSDIEIVNPELHIATLTSRDAELEMELVVEKGRGFMSTESREKQKRDIGLIAIDALFSPIRRVSIKVEGARVGQMTNFDKLLVEIETDGTIMPQTTVTEAAKIIIEHFKLLLSENFSVTEKSADEMSEKDEPAESVAEIAPPAKKKKATKKQPEIE